VLNISNTKYFIIKMDLKNKFIYLFIYLENTVGPKKQFIMSLKMQNAKTDSIHLKTNSFVCQNRSKIL